MKLDSVFDAIGPNRTACVNVSLCCILVPLDIAEVFHVGRVVKTNKQEKRKAKAVSDKK